MIYNYLDTSFTQRLREKKKEEEKIFLALGCGFDIPILREGFLDLFV